MPPVAAGCKPPPRAWCCRRGPPPRRRNPRTSCRCLPSAARCWPPRRCWAAAASIRRRPKAACWCCTGGPVGARFAPSKAPRCKSCGTPSAAAACRCWPCRSTRRPSRRWPICARRTTAFRPRGWAPSCSAAIPSPRACPSPWCVARTGAWRRPRRASCFGGRGAAGALAVAAYSERLVHGFTRHPRHPRLQNTKSLMVAEQAMRVSPGRGLPGQRACPRQGKAQQREACADWGRAIHAHRAPSTSMHTPLTKAASSLAR
jgi:hypothetical protein